jgi:chromate transporter
MAGEDGMTSTLTQRVPEAACEPTQVIPFAVATRFWFRLGCISFGGPAGQIAIMHRELVEQRRWIPESRFLHALNYCMLLPGPEAQQLATYIGWLLHGTRGALVAGSLFVLPSLVLLIALSWIYVVFGTTAGVTGVLYGVRPAVVAIVLFAAWRIGSRTLTNLPLAAIAAAAFVALFFLHVPFPYVVLAAGIIGFVLNRLLPAALARTAHDAGGSSAALADDETPARPAIPRARHATLRYAIVGLGLWICVEGLLYAAFGWRGTFTQMGWFFSKAALVTFGGAYAVLPYVQHAAVETYAWLAPGQMIDGLALGETTPGPLIMVVTFVGFLGGWTQSPFGPGYALIGGIGGALVATFFTFLPSFLFILIGAPFVEARHGDLKFAGPLTAITAAVVGVIVNLAVVFAGHVLWPAPSGDFNVLSALIIVGAMVALAKYKVGVVAVILLSALVGLAAVSV